MFLLSLYSGQPELGKGKERPPSDDAVTNEHAYSMFFSILGKKEEKERNYISPADIVNTRIGKLMLVYHMTRVKTE